MSEESALTHVLTVFRQSERDNVRLALVDGGTERVSDLKELTFGDFSQLQHAQPAASDAEVGVSKHLNILQRRKLLLIPLWCQEQDVHELSAWFNLTLEIFNTWRKDRADEATTGSTQSPQGTSTKTSAAQCFLKGVRRNVADCTKFKEAKQWQRWKRHLQSAATAQGVEQVFDPNYMPATTEDIELFNEKQKFGCQILEQTVQTQEGMTIVREHSKTKDAQSVHAKLTERYEHSQAATLAQDALERELGELRLDTTSEPRPRLVESFLDS
jgi:hypothetical protein